MANFWSRLFRGQRDPEERRARQIEELIAFIQSRVDAQKEDYHDVVVAYGELVDLYLEGEDPERAEEYCIRALQHEKIDEPIPMHVKLAGIQVQRGMLKEDLQSEFETQLDERVKPLSTQSGYMKGSDYFKMIGQVGQELGLYDHAELAYRKVLDRNKGDGEANFHLGALLTKAHVEDGDMDEALSHLRVAINVDRQYARAALEHPLYEALRETQGFKDLTGIIVGQTEPEQETS